MKEQKGVKLKTETNTENEVEFIEKVIKINRVNKVVKGGKRLAFRAFCIIGDLNGSVAYGLGKSKEVPVAIKKGMDRAKKRLVKLNIIEGTLPHKVIGQFGASRVIILPAKPGTGVIAGGAVRVILEAAGLKNVVAKSLGSRNVINVARATLNGLLMCRNQSEAEETRGKKLSIFINKLEEDDYDSSKKIILKTFKDQEKSSKKYNNDKSSQKPDKSEKQIEDVKQEVKQEATNKSEKETEEKKNNNNQGE